MRRLMRRFTISLLAGLMLTLASLGSALGHVHGITPLGCVTTANPLAGGNGTNGTRADDDLGGPIFGVIPISLGNAPLVSGVDGGRHSALC
jgi:hypothetical protein